MSAVVVGLSQHNAPQALFEASSLMGDRWSKMLTEISHSSFVSESVIVATCNRTEVYVRAERFHEAYQDIRNALSVVTGVSDDELVPHLYVHYGQDAAAHLFRVASGLDSVVVGEHEVLGQIRKAWDDARTFGSAGPHLNLMFQRSVEVGKLVRTETKIGQGTTSVAAAAVNLLAERADLHGKRAVLVGAGDVGRNAAATLRTKVSDLTVINRTAATAADIAAELEAATVPFAQLAEAVADADIVVCATAAPEAVIDSETVSQSRTDRPLTIVDLAMPVDVTPEVASLEGIEVLRLLDIQRVANRGLENRQTHRREAEDLVLAELERYRAAASAQEVAPLVSALHQRAEAVRAEELNRAAAKLGGLDDAQRTALEAATKRIVSTLLHDPTVELKSAAGSPRGERLAAALRELFDLD